MNHEKNHTDDKIGETGDIQAWKWCFHYQCVFDFWFQQTWSNIEQLITADLLDLRMCVVPFIRNCREKHSYACISMIHLWIQSWLHPQFWAIALQCHFRRREDSSLRSSCVTVLQPSHTAKKLHSEAIWSHAASDHRAMPVTRGYQGHVCFHCYILLHCGAKEGLWKMDGWMMMDDDGWIDHLTSSYAA